MRLKKGVVVRIKHRSFKQRLTDINILLACLLFFGMSLGLVAQRGTVGDKVLHKTMSLPNFFAYIHPLVQAHGVGKIARAIHQFAHDKDEEVLQGIIEHQDWPLTRNDKVLLLTAFAALHKDAPAKQNQILNFISRHADLFSQGEPLLYVVAYHEAYKEEVLKQEIPLLLRWIQQVKKTGGAPFITQAVREALLYTVEKDDPDTLWRLTTSGVPLDKELATQLVWNVVEGRKNPDFIDELKKSGADFNKPKGSYTPLMKALLDKNKPLVEQLLKSGADPNIMIDKSVGAPLQILLSEGIRAKQEGRMNDMRLYNELDEMLRTYGARE